MKPNFVLLIFLFAALFFNSGCQKKSESFRYDSNRKSVIMEYQRKPVLTRKEILVKTKNEGTLNFPVKIEGNKMIADLGKFGIYSEEFNSKDSSTTIGRISLQVKTSEAFIVQCPFEFPKEKAKPYFMIPGFLYGTNNLATSDGQQPKLNYGGKVDWPNSSLIYCRADRSTHPGVLTIRDHTVIMVGISEKVDSVEIIPADKWSPGYLYNGLMLDSSDPQTDRIGFQIGYENAPKRYSWEKPENPKNEEYLFGWIEGQEGKTIHTSTFYYTGCADEITSYGKALKAYYGQIHQMPIKRSTRKEAMEKISKAIVDYSWREKSKTFILADGPDTSDGSVGDIAWTGGVQVAYPLLKTALKIGDKRSETVALDFINNLCSGKVMNQKAGLLKEEFRKGVWQITGWWGVREDCFNFGNHPLHSAYLNGQASYYLLKAYELTGKQNHSWLETAKTVLETAMRNQNKDGAYPCFFDPETGIGVDYDGFQSCWFMPGMVMMFKLTKDSTYLKSAEKAIDYYHQFHLRGELYGTPMDTHRSTDEEGNLSFIVGSVELHKLTGLKKYLDFGMDGLNWEYSWKFAYNTAHTNEPLRSMNWSSCGGSITSSYNVSIHQMGNLVAGEMYYLFTQLKDPYIESRLKDVCIWGLGAYNTKDNDFGYGKTGQATEQFFYTDGLVLPWYRPWDGGVWEASLSWASACILQSCSEEIPDKYFGE